MLVSMTGYGRAQQILSGRDIQVELKSVNHRFFEFGCRSPRSYQFLEERLKKRVQERVTRGKVDLSLSVQNLTAEALSIHVNEGAAAAYAEALRQLSAIAGIDPAFSVEALTRYPEVFTVEKATEDEEALWADVASVLDEALDRFVAMRAREGESLGEDLMARLAAIEKGVVAVEKAGPRLVSDYRERLTTKIAEVLSDRQMDEARILTEAAVFAERTDVGEETVRLRSHLMQFAAILKEGGPVGRKLDFLTQELNREVNTIGSKIQDIEVSRVVVDMKSDIEKIREQIQNLE